MNKIIQNDFDENEKILKLKMQLLELDNVKLEDIGGENLKAIAENYLKEKLTRDLDTEIKKSNFDFSKYKEIFLATLNSRITERNYRHSIDEFFKWSGDKSPFDISSIDIDTYIVYLKSKKYSENSIRFKIAAVGSLFSYLVRHEILSRNCCGKRKLPRRRIEIKSFNDVPTEKELTEIENELIKSMNAKGRGSTLKIKGSKTLLASILFMKESACRVGALPSIRLDLLGHFIARSKELDVRGKISIDTMSRIAELGFDRFAPFKDVKIDSIKKYFEIVCKRLFMKGQIRKVYSPHCIRHYAAVKFWNEHHDIYLLKKFLNHKSIATSQVYLASLNMEV